MIHMAAGVVDSGLWREMYGTPEMRGVFDDQALVQRWLDVEAALARAQGELGIIPKEAAAEISRQAEVANLDLTELVGEFAATGHPIMALIRALQRACQAKAGEYIHWGATSQDIMDTACVLQVKRAVELIEAGLGELTSTCIRLARHHRDTVMAGRTHGQHAVPITFGYKVAVWVAELRRHIQRLEECQKRVLVLELSGAAGTLATIHPDQGFALQELVARELGLEVPPITWHTAHDGFAEVASVLAMIMGTLGKIANEIVLLQKTEIAEVEEPVAGRIGSSTMPHKRNPMQMEHVVALSRLVRANAHVVLDSMVPENERDWRAWASEMKPLSESFIMTAAAIRSMKGVLERLVVRKDNMRRNLDILKGLLLSERVMMALADRMGRQTAHEVVYRASMEAFERQMSFQDVLAADPKVRTALSDEEIERLLNPSEYLGLAPYYVDRVCGDRVTGDPIAETA